jgi:hypothetical protein
MKKFILLISAAANIALLALVISSSFGKSGASSSGGATSPAEIHATSKGKKNTDGPMDIAAVGSGFWKEMANVDLATQVARMREAKLPESLIRMIVSAQLSQQYEERYNALRASLPKAPYWQNDTQTDPQIRAALRELSNEYTKQMTALLGSVVSDDPVSVAIQRAQYGDLPREKIDQIMRIQRDYSELSEKLYDVGTITPDIRAKLSQLQAEQRNDIIALLTPQEAEDYELRTGTTANRMRSSLFAFNPNEQEFRTIFKLQKQFDEQYNTQTARDLPTAAQADFARQRNEAQKQLNAELATALGGERGVEYERAVDTNFQQVYRVVERLELPKEAAVQVWETQKSIQERMTALNKTPAADARNELALLAQEANARVSAILGERGLEVYKQYGGAWLQNIQNRQVPPGGAGGARGGGGGPPDGFQLR